MGMREKCSKCKSDKFYIKRIHQVNGNDDTFECICTKCGDYHELYEE